MWGAYVNNLYEGALSAISVIRAVLKGAFIKNAFRFLLVHVFRNTTKSPLKGILKRIKVAKITVLKLCRLEFVSTSCFDNLIVGYLKGVKICLEK